MAQQILVATRCVHIREPISCVSTANTTKYAIHTLCDAAGAQLVSYTKTTPSVGYSLDQHQADRQGA
jgi:hypothetical protein